MFWAAIIYGMPSAKWPFPVLVLETEAQKVEAKQQNAQRNMIIDHINQVTYQPWKTEHVAKPKWQRRQGRLFNPDPIQLKKRLHGAKGGIDWYHYQITVLDRLLSPFYDQMVKSHQRQERGPIYLLEDGAGPHRAESLNSFRHAKVSLFCLVLHN